MSSAVKHYDRYTYALRRSPESPPPPLPRVAAENDALHRNFGWLPLNRYGFAVGEDGSLHSRIVAPARHCCAPMPYHHQQQQQHAQQELGNKNSSSSSAKSKKKKAVASPAVVPFRKEKQVEAKGDPPRQAPAAATKAMAKAEEILHRSAPDFSASSASELWCKVRSAVAVRLSLGLATGSEIDHYILSDPAEGGGIGLEEVKFILRSNGRDGAGGEGAPTFSAVEIARFELEWKKRRREMVPQAAEEAVYQDYPERVVEEKEEEVSEKRQKAIFSQKLSFAKSAKAKVDTGPHHRPTSSSASPRPSSAAKGSSYDGNQQPTGYFSPSNTATATAAGGGGALFSSPPPIPPAINYHDPYFHGQEMHRDPYPYSAAAAAAPRSSGSGSSPFTLLPGSRNPPSPRSPRGGAAAVRCSSPLGFGSSQRRMAPVAF